MSMILDGTNGATFNDGSLQAAAASPYVLKNRIINGAMVIDQRNAGASVTAASGGGYCLDRYQYVATQSSKYSVQQNAGSITPPDGFTNYLGVTSLSAYSVISSDIFSIGQNIEGFNTADLMYGTANAKTVTLSFWVRSSLTGTFGGSFENSSVNRAYPFTYTISSANTWEYKTITVAGDTSGTWVGATNGVGLRVWFNLGAGSTYSGTAGAWAGSDFRSATGATSVVGTNGATFYITGVQLEIGSTATPFERRLYNQELANCYRYFYKLGGPFNDGASSYMHYGIGWWYATTLAFVVTTFPVTMRGTPSFSVTNPTNFYVNTNGAVSAITVDQVSRQTCDWYATGPTSTLNSATRVYGINGTVNSVQFDAEL